MSERPNVLVTSASRKVLLVRAFRDALTRLGSGRVVAADVDPMSAALFEGSGRVVAADVVPMSAALFEADTAFLVPRSEDPSFVPAIRRLCREQGVGLIVPTRDEELALFAATRADFAEDGVLVLVSSPEAVATCQDKRRFGEAVAAAGLDAPRTWNTKPTPLPAFVKPRIGKGSHGTAGVRTQQQLEAAVAALDGDALVQEWIDAPEYTVDVFADLEGRPITCVPRERMQVLAGESVVSRTVRDEALSAATLRLVASIGLIGHVTVQAFRTPDRIAFIEINPRYGGAANLSFAAGAPTPELAIRLARGERLEPRLGQYETGLVMLRHAEDRFVRDGDVHFAKARP